MNYTLEHSMSIPSLLYDEKYVYANTMLDARWCKAYMCTITNIYLMLHTHDTVSAEGYLKSVCLLLYYALAGKE